MMYDVAIVGGGPAGLAGALALGRARKRVLLCDSGPRRNAAAVHMQNFVTRDGTPPAEFRRIGRSQLEPYRNVDVRDVAVESIAGERGAFAVRLSSGADVTARRILLCTGMVDEVPAIEGARELWGTSIIICPYCHGWEVQDQRFGVLLEHADRLPFALLLRGWSRDVVLFTNGKLAVPDELRAQFASANVRIEERPIVRFTASDGRLTGVALDGGEVVPRDILFTHPQQWQVPVVRALGVALDQAGFVAVNDQRETSIPGIYAGGDLTTAMQTAIAAAAAGTFAAAMLNLGLTVELATTGTLP